MHAALPALINHPPEAGGITGMTTDTQQQLMAKFEELERVNQEMTELLGELGRMDDVPDYAFKDRGGNSVRLSELFGDHEQMVLVHNMGFSCSYCTLWADGFNGIWRHLESGAYGNKARFVLVSEDSPEKQAEGSEKRGWTFDMYTAAGTDFSADMGYKTERDGKHYLQPGASIFHKDADGKIRRHARTYFGPGDMYCSLFHFFSLLPQQPAEQAV